MHTRLRSLLPYAPHVLLALIVMGPLLLPGFVLSMDMVFTPVLRMSDHVDNTWLFYTSLHVLNFVIPADALQKLLLFGVFIASGVGAYRLLLSLRPPNSPTWRLAVYAGSVLYEINPFVYDRLMAGQYGVLLGFALLPWFALALWKFTRDPTLRTTLAMTVWAVAMSIVSIHSIGFVAVLVVVAGASVARDKRRREAFVRFGLVSLAIFIVASSYWLLPALTGQGRIAESLGTFTESGRAAFATVDVSGLTPLGSVLGLQGFWQETRGLFLLPSEGIWLWEWVQLLLWIVLAIGAWRLWAERRLRAVAVGSVGLLALVLALGVGGDWLTAHVPFFAGYREPQKFVAVLVLVYAYLMTHGVAWLLVKSRRWQMPVAVAATILPLLYTPVLLWGAYGQLRATEYPADWFTANKMLQSKPAGDVLVLPWHLYMRYGFSGRIIANPAAAFYDRSVVTSDDPELPGVAPQTRNTVRENVSRLLTTAPQPGLTQQLQALGIRYVLVNKELDYQDYDYMRTATGAKQLQDSQTLKLYELTNDTMEQHANN